MKNNTPLVSIVIPVYNGSNYLREAIDSALAQTYPNIEVIVVNDGSTDKGKTEKIAKSYGNKIRYYAKKNGGVSSALNYGIKKMKGEYFSWLSHDDVYMPNKVLDEINAIKDKDKTTIVFSNFHLIDKNGKIFATTHSEERATEKAISSNIFPVLKGMVNGDTILIHRSIFKKSGVFNESAQTAADYQMWLKIFNEYNHVFLDKPLAKYRIHSEQDTKKHPEYNKESDEFWSNAIDCITEKLAKTWDASLLQIYTDLYIQFQNDNLKESAKKIYNLCLERANIDKPLISIVIPTFNSEKYLRDALDSLLKSDFGNFEAIVIDDGSTDSTPDIIDSYSRKDFRIKTVLKKNNSGVADSLNRGLKAARGEYFARLDSDDSMLPNRLLRQYLFMEKNRLDFCATNINLMDESGRITKNNSYSTEESPIQFMAAFTNPIPNSTIMYSMSAIRKYHLKFPNLKFAEDYAFLLRFLQHGGKGASINEGLYNYRILEKSLYHGNEQAIYKKSLELSSDYVSSVSKKLRKDSLFYLISPFVLEKEFEITDCFFKKIVQDSEQYISEFSRRYNFTEKEILECRVFLLKHIHENLIPKIEISEVEYSMKTPFRMTYYFLKKNGVKKTLVKIYEKISRKKHDNE